MGEIPVLRLKYLPKKDCDGKFSIAVTSLMESIPPERRRLASVVTRFSIMSDGATPDMDLMTVEKWRWLRCCRSA